jgi:hypothetical protein
MILTFKLTRERLRPRTHPSKSVGDDDISLGQHTPVRTNILVCCTGEHIRNTDSIYLPIFSQVNTSPCRSHHCHLLRTFDIIIVDKQENLTAISTSTTLWTIE